MYERTLSVITQMIQGFFEYLTVTFFYYFFCCTKVFLTFQSVNENLKCLRLNEAVDEYFYVVLFKFML